MIQNTNGYSKLLLTIISALIGIIIAGSSLLWGVQQNTNSKQEAKIILNTTDIYENKTSIKVFYSQIESLKILIEKLDVKYEKLNDKIDILLRRTQ